MNCHSFLVYRLSYLFIRFKLTKMKDIIVEKIDAERNNLALRLSFRVFLECNSCDFNNEGIQLFNKFLNDEESIKMLTIYGAFNNGILVGVLGCKNNERHISLFFVEKEYQGNGIGRRLFDTLIEDTKTDHIIVSSSTTAIKVYEKMGFKQIIAAQEKNGLIVLMEYHS